MTIRDDEKVVMYDSPEAATRVDMPGWKSRLGHFYPGDNASSEHGARWSGCTHMTCACGRVHDKERTICRACEAKIDCDKYYALEMVEWDETTPVCDYKSDNYFWDREDVLEHLFDVLEDAQKNGYEPESRLVICEPRYLHPIDCETWSDDLADEGELSDEVGAAVDALNAVLKAQGPSCWYPGKQRINMEPLWAELKADLEKEKAEGLR